MKQIGIVGLGKMGYNLALNMLDNQFEVYGYDKYPMSENINHQNFHIYDSIRVFVENLIKPRLIWLMVPAGKITDDVIQEISQYLEKDDILIDGGNSKYTDTLRRYETLKTKGLHLVDCGTSGGTTGARYGASLMVGGDKDIIKDIEWLFTALAVEDGYAHVGETGSGHFVKMVHNGVEYGMMQAIGEGFDLINASQYKINLKSVAKVWANGSIIEGLLMNTVLEALKKDGNLDGIVGRVDDSGEGQWTIEEALKLKVSTPVIAQALFSRFKSRDDLHFSEKIVAAMRNEFGGHKVYKKS